MPVYEYKCPTCGYEKEISHKMSEVPKILCEKCPYLAGNTVEGSEMVKQISLGSFSLKGTGWYRDGYKGK